MEDYKEMIKTVAEHLMEDAKGMGEHAIRVKNRDDEQYFSGLFKGLMMIRDIAIDEKWLESAYKRVKEGQV